MASLANQTISSTYDGLVKTSTDQPVPISGVQLLEDGVGNSLALSVGRANQGVTITGTATATAFAGPLTGNVTGNLTGNVTGNVAGNVTGNVTGDLTGNVSGNVTGDLTGDVTGTVLTAAQTNITSVGTLSSLAVSGNLTVDTDTLFVDAANNFVGIKTTSSEAVASVTPADLQVKTTGIGASIVSVANAAGPAGILALGHGRGTASGLLQNNDAIGQIRFAAGDGTDIQTLAAQISVEVDGTAGANDMPSRMVFSTTADGNSSPTEAMRINSSRNVGIGTSSPTSYTDGTTLEIKGKTGTGAGLAKVTNANGTTSGAFYAAATALTIGSQTNHDLNFITNNSVKASITSGGEVLVGKTQVDNRYQGIIAFPAGLMTLSRDGAATETMIGFFRNFSASVVGNITTTSTSTAYNTSSDYRLKENVVEMTGALDRVDALKPSRFNFIADPEKTVDGFLAHEVQEVVPEAITGEKDAVDEEGNPIYQGIDQSKIVPLLVGAIQELKAEIETLKAQING